MQRRYYPSQMKTREYESNLGLYRLDKHMTIQEFCEASGIHQTTYSGLNNGMLSPFHERYKNLGLRKPVKRLLDFLKVGVEDLFPRYVCTLKNNELADSQISEILISQYSKEYGSNNETQTAKEVSRELRLAVETLTEREQIVIEQHYFEGKTYVEIGKDLHASKQTIQQVLLKALRKLRHPSRASQLEALYKPKKETINADWLENDN